MRGMSGCRFLLRSRQDGPMLWRALAPFAIALCGLSVLSGCGQGSADRAGVAAAKCSLPVAERIDKADPLQVQTSGAEVTSLGSGRYRVTGAADMIGGNSYSFAPDPSDKLRGFRVTSLQVKPSTQ